MLELGGEVKMRMTARERNGPQKKSGYAVEPIKSAVIGNRHRQLDWT